MVITHGFLSHGTVYPGGFNALVAEEFLYLLNRHTSCQEIRCTCPPEAVRVNIFYACRAADAVNDIFQPAPGKAVMWSFTADEEGRIIVSTGIQIVFEVDVGAGVEVCHALLVPLAEYGDIVFGKRDISAVKAQEFGCPYCGAVQAFHDGQFAFRFTGGADKLDFRRGQRFFDPLLVFYGIDGIKGIGCDQPFFDKPFEKDIQDQTDLVKVRVTYSPLVAVIVKVGINIVVSDQGDIFVSIRKKV